MAALGLARLASLRVSCAMRAAKAAKDLKGAASDLSDRLGRVFQDEVRAFGDGIGVQLSVETKAWFCEYLEQKALPLLRAVVRALCAEHPQSPSAFVALMLVDELLGSAEPLTSDLRASLSRTKDSEPEPDPQPDLLEPPLGSCDLPGGSPSAASGTTAAASAADASAVAAADVSAVSASDDCQAATAGEPAVSAKAAGSKPDGPRPPDGPKPHKSAPRKVTLGREEMQSVMEPAVSEGTPYKTGAADDVEALHTTPASCSSANNGRSDGSRKSRNVTLEDDMIDTLLEPAVLEETPCNTGEATAPPFAPETPASPKSGGGDGTHEKRLKRAYTMQQKVAPLPREQLLAHLRQVPNMAALTERELERVADICQMREYDQDEVIMSYGQSCDELHIIVSGNGDLSVPQTIGALKTGSFFGQEALQASSVKTAAQLTASGGPVTTISVSRSRFKELSVQKVGKIKKKSVKGNKKDAQAHMSCDNHNLSKTLGNDMCSITGHKLHPSYQKTAADREMIELSVKRNKVLGEVMGLSDEQLHMVSEGVHMVEVKADVEVFKKGEWGNALFIVHDGVLKVVGLDIVLRAGDAFGELALMYDEPRSATIQATRDSKLWVFPRNSFKEVTQVSAKRRLAEYSDMLWNVPVIRDNINQKLLGMLAAALEDEGMLFLVFEGTCVYDEEVDGEKVERHLNRGDWIGEDQLMLQLPADTTVRVTSETATVVALYHQHFELVQNASKDESMANSANDLVELQELTRSFKKKQSSRMTTAVRRRASVGGRASISASATLALGMDKMDAKVNLSNCETAGVLGEGSFGLVLYLKDCDPGSKDDSAYALKILSKEQLRETQQESMVQNERSVLNLLDSNFIVRLHNTYEDPNYVYLLLEVVMGGELFDIFTEYDFWGDLDKACFYTACVALGLAHLHSKRVIWRDLKLENCLVNAKGYLKLADMGIAKQVVGKTYTVCGTVDYFAPEQLKQVGYNRGADWWALGILLFIMVAGHSPFDAPEVSQVYRNIIKGLSKVVFPAAFSPEAEECVKQLCRKKPQERITMQRGGVSNLMQLPFFEGLDWEALLEMRAPAPWVPPAPDYEKISQRKPSTKFEIDLKELKEWQPDDDPANASSAADG
eukprot:TRINITY_DN7102_c0_g1_i2.p1 TRINITY_DN7102_c0_g1~~TRINITY_DN7102_c0_g1_i2.p1  ORF type:complete len:1123 (+),score=282.30 TRINITY_DN7102_c0_g1_i2:253-3621(+)